MCSVELREEGEFTVPTKDRQGVYERCANGEMWRLVWQEKQWGEGNHLYS